MDIDIRRAAVIGAGWMGTDMAVLLASAGIETLLLDVATAAEPGDAERKAGLTARSDEWRSRIARDALSRVEARRDFLDPESRARIRAGNLDDHRDLLTGVDWVIEAVTESLDVKRALYATLAGCLRPDTVVTSTTSSFEISSLTEGLDETFCQRFFIAHFFNPVRQTNLCEVSAGTDANRRLVERFSKFVTSALGKGVIATPETPGFLANRLGLFALMTAMHYAESLGLGIETCDRLTGFPLARPSSGTFRTLDLIGLDTVVQILDHLHEALTDDPFRERFRTPDFLRRLTAEGFLGDKQQGGFYRREGDRTCCFDLKTGTHRASEFEPGEELDRLDRIPKPGDRIRALRDMDGPAGRFAWLCLRDTLSYAGYLLGRLTDKPLILDRAMRWGYNWELGPFEIWDALGVRATTAQMEEEGAPVPESVRALIEAGQESWYTMVDARRRQFDVAEARWVDAPKPKGVLNLGEAALLEQAGEFRLYDLGDGIGCVSIVPPYAEGAQVDPDFIDNLNRLLDVFSREKLAGLVITGQSRDFSLGLNMEVLLAALDAKNFGAIEAQVQARQGLNQRLKTLGVPIMAVLAGKTLGAGYEMAMHCGRLQAHSEVQIGMGAVRFGLIPSGGGCKEMLFRAVENTRVDGPFPIVSRAFERIMDARLARGAFIARNLGYFRKVDRFTLDRKRLLTDAKAELVNLLQHGFAPPPRPPLSLPGAGGRAYLEHLLMQRRLRGEIGEELQVIGAKLAHVLCGGDCSPLERLTEDRMLELEREAFLSLCGMEQTPRLIRQKLARRDRPLR